MRIRADGGASSWVVVPPQPYVAMTDEEGKAHFDEVPAGRYTVVAWHPPLLMPGEPTPQAPVSRGEITVERAASATAVLSLAPTPTPTP